MSTSAVPFLAQLTAEYSKLPKSGNGTKISDENWHSVKSKYLKNIKQKIYCKKHQNNECLLVKVITECFYRVIFTECNYRVFEPSLYECRRVSIVSSFHHFQINF